MIHRADIGQIGSMIATNTVLFSALDLGQWIADGTPCGRSPLISWPQ